ncbi:MAG TPA: oligosaccharide repeat unit polymerase, partial [Firmicutes bacterium]|nr:oligosaccharide repeat unit polymerase [Bacillota bacterium]
YLFNVVFLPNDNFNLKIISLILLYVINITCFLSLNGADEKLIFYCGFVLTCITIFCSIVNTGVVLNNIKMGYPGYILLLYLIIKKRKLSFKKYFCFILSLMAVFVCLMGLLDIIQIIDLNDNPILLWLVETENAMVGKGSHLPIYYMIFLKTSPLLFILLFYSLRDKHYWLSILAIIALVLSGTRANIFILLIALSIYFIFVQKRLYKKILAVFILLLVFLFMALNNFDLIIDIFVRKSSSDDVRSGHLQGILEVWNQDPLSLIVGSGYSAEFYSYGRNALVSNIELSYWNLLRQVGLICFIPMLYMYIYPLYRLILRHKYTETLPYLCYLIIAYTNPFLYSSTGITLLVFEYIEAFNANRIKQYKCRSVISLLSPNNTIKI